MIKNFFEEPNNIEQTLTIAKMYLRYSFFKNKQSKYFLKDIYYVNFLFL